MVPVCGGQIAPLIVRRALRTDAAACARTRSARGTSVKVIDDGGSGTPRPRLDEVHCLSPRHNSRHHCVGGDQVSVRVASAQDVKPGEMHVFDVAGTNVNVTSTGDHLYAFDDTCTHMGCSLAEGQLAGTVVTCPCHGSRFDVTSGAVIRGPAQRPVRSRAVQVRGDDLLVDE